MHFSVYLSAAFLIVLFGYLILRTYHYRLDLSEDRVYGLSPQSIQVLEALRSEPVHVYGFFKEDQGTKTILENLLKEYAYRHPKFHYEFYDPDRMPAKVKQFGVDAYGTIVIEAKGRHEKTTQVTEEAITNLLARLHRQETKRIVFATGYGGPPLEEETKPDGYGLLRKKLIDFNYEVRESFLARDKISRGTDLVVIAGPHVDLLPAELDIVKTYLERGGNLLVLMDPVQAGEGKNLQKFLQGYGIRLGEDVVVDKLSKLFGADYLIPLVTEYKPHPITRGFRLASFFPVARSVRKNSDVPKDFEVVEFAWTGVGSWAETNLKDLSEGKAEFDAKHDEKGPLPVAAAVTTVGEPSRLVVFGDSDFVTNHHLNLSGNRDLFFNAVAWLAGDEFAIAIRPRLRKVTPLYLTERDQKLLFYVSVLGFPLSFLLGGTFLFFWRRQYR